MLPKVRRGMPFLERLNLMRQITQESPMLELFVIIRDQFQDGPRMPTPECYERRESTIGINVKSR
jgi:hypothetical protein